MTKPFRLIACAMALAMGLGPTTTLEASVIAVIDSGTDLMHKELFSKIWTNPTEIENNDSDEDQNGYVDDMYGWNFAENNNQLIDYTYLNRLTFDVKKFFEIQSRRMLGQASETEIQWMKEKLKDQKFVKDLQVYGNFMHGTHVAGIAAKNAPEAKILAVKLIPTEIKLPFPLPGQKSGEFDTIGDEALKFLLKKGLDTLAKQQMKVLSGVASYINGHKAEIANCSFGTGYVQAKELVKMVFTSIIQREPTEEEVHQLTKYFLSSLIKEGQTMVSSAQDTLFVFAAGNDGMDNDQYPTSPAGIRAINALTVAASNGTGSIASFSNFGAQTVDVVAPGVAVLSSVPGNNYLRVSGTSQATPFVAQIAGVIKDLNPSLGPSEIKSIIMKTVDIRSEWATKVRSSGLVNSKRATRAAELSKEFALNRAIAMAKTEVPDSAVTPVTGNDKLDIDLQGMILPLPSLFTITK